MAFADKLFLTENSNQNTFRQISETKFKLFMCKIVNAF